MRSGKASLIAKRDGFTMIELLVALAIIALLLSIAAPRYFGGVDKAKDQVLREDLFTLRDSLDKYYADNGKYPDTLQDLVDHHYLRLVPVDPFTNSNQSWSIIAPTDKRMGGVFDVKSAAPGKARDGTLYQDW